MKTQNFNIDLMTPNQINKDVIFNEALITIDALLKHTINGFVESKNENIDVGKKYIITGEEDKNHIYYMSSIQEKHTTPPQNGMLLFSIPNNNFLLYENDGWREIQIGGGNNNIPNIDQNFTSINESFEILNNKSNFYLYLNGDTAISLGQINIPEITILIKQCYNASYTLTWPHNILWENQTTHVMVDVHNTMEVVKLFKLPETDHFLGKIVSKNHKF